MKAYTITISQDFAGPFSLNTGFPIWHLYSSLSSQHTLQSNGSSLLPHDEQTILVWLVLSVMPGMLTSSLITFH